jgi:hypothetical protein
MPVPSTWPPPMRTSPPIPSRRTTFSRSNVARTATATGASAARAPVLHRAVWTSSRMAMKPMSTVVVRHARSVRWASSVARARTARPGPVRPGPVPLRRVRTESKTVTKPTSIAGDPTASPARPATRVETTTIVSPRRVLAAVLEEGCRPTPVRARMLERPQTSARPATWERRRMPAHLQSDRSDVSPRPAATTSRIKTRPMSTVAVPTAVPVTRVGTAVAIATAGATSARTGPARLRPATIARRMPTRPTSTVEGWPANPVPPEEGVGRIRIVRARSATTRKPAKHRRARMAFKTAAKPTSIAGAIAERVRWEMVAAKTAIARVASVRTAPVNRGRVRTESRTVARPIPTAVVPTAIHVGEAEAVRRKTIAEVASATVEPVPDRPARMVFRIKTRPTSTVAALPVPRVRPARDVDRGATARVGAVGVARV